MADHQKVLDEGKKEGTLIEIPDSTDLNSALRIIQSFMYQKLHE